MQRQERTLLLAGAAVLGYMVLSQAARRGGTPAGNGLMLQLPSMRGITPSDPSTGVLLTPEAFRAYGEFYHNVAAPEGITGPQYYPVPGWGGGGFGRY